MSYLIGKILANKYHVVEQLGRGGSGQVFKALQLNPSRPVAIKVIHTLHRMDDDKYAEFVERFQHEADSVARLRHPNIVRVYDYDNEEDMHFMVMEFIEGLTLEAELKKRRARGQLFTLAETLSILKPLASAIDHAHGRGLIHRDLKPSNIMITPDNEVVLTDFGIARLIDAPRFTRSGIFIGTPTYASPEQAQEEELDKPSDIYSLGVILFEMVTGRVPFGARYPLAILMQHINEPPPQPTTINPRTPEAVERVILKALNKNPADRYQTAGDLFQELEEAIRQAETDESHQKRTLYEREETTPSLLIPPRQISTATKKFLAAIGTNLIALAIFRDPNRSFKEKLSVALHDRGIILGSIIGIIAIVVSIIFLNIFINPAISQETPTQEGTTVAVSPSILTHTPTPSPTPRPPTMTPLPSPTPVLTATPLPSPTGPLTDTAISPTPSPTVTNIATPTGTPTSASTTANFPTATPVPLLQVQRIGVVYHDAESVSEEGVGFYGSGTRVWLDLLVRLGDNNWYGPERQEDEIDALPLPEGYYWETDGGFSSLENGEVWWNRNSNEGRARLYYRGSLLREHQLRIEFTGSGGGGDDGSGGTGPVLVF